ncbi:tyrosine phosphatase-like protein, partial [Leptotrombidium deliense]
VILSEYPGVPGSDYINANYIRGSTGSSCAYIASQGPLPNTVVDYWRMIWETEVSVIVMACNETESGKYKCECYWPENSDQEQQYGNITVRIVKWRHVCPDFLVRTFKITCDSKSRRVCQFHYTTWPDHGVPSTVHPILELVRLMRDCESRETRPILVHCSAGCGRTGTICSIDYVWALLRTGRLTEDFSLFNIISDMRRQRIAMVQTQEQYMLCYRAVAALFEQQLKLIDAHTYENLDEDGEPLMLTRTELLEGSTPPANGDEQSTSVDTSDQESTKETEPELSPTKDVQHLIGAWHLNTIRKSNQEISSQSQKNTGDTKQEKLVGKATVIRRPSIAKLKALFENRQPFDAFNADLLPYERRNKIKLQRSHSTRERGSNAMFNEDETLRMNTSLSEPKKLAAKYMNDRKQQTNVSDCAFSGSSRRSEQLINNFTFGDHETFQNNIDKPWSSQHSSFSLPSEDNATNDFNWDNPLNNCISNNYQSNGTDSRAEADEAYQLEMPCSENAPPKPPRTFQYTCETRRSDEESPCESDVQYTNGGRIIVSVALPKIRGTLKGRKCDGLSQSSNRHSEESNFYDIPSSQATRNASESNIYEPQVARSIPNVRKELSKSTQGLAIAEPIYYEAGNRNAAFTNFKTMGMKNLRRDMSVPALSIPQNFMPNKFVPKTNVRNGVVTQLRHPNPKFISCDQSRQTALFNQQAQSMRGWNMYGYPVSFVRPHSNNNVNGKPIAINAATVPKQENLKNETENKAEKKTSEKTNKDIDDKNGAISHENDKREKKQGHSLASFFNFRKKKKEKLKNNVNVPQTQTAQNVSSTVTTVRPPHSHRFLPPTQWTQV